MKPVTSDDARRMRRLAADTLRLLRRHGAGTAALAAHRKGKRKRPKG